MLRAGDIEDHCRKLLLVGPGIMRPQCIFGDILQRCPDRVSRKLDAVASQCRDAVAALVSAGVPEYAAAKRVGMSFLDEVHRVFFELGKLL